MRETNGSCATEGEGAVVRVDTSVCVCIVCEEGEGEFLGDRSELARKGLKLWVCRGVTLF